MPDDDEPYCGYGPKIDNIIAGLYVVTFTLIAAAIALLVVIL